MPSLYETTAVVGDVESGNFTTLYNASGLTVPNAGAGTVSGNLNVAGNLTVQGSSLLQGAVTLGSTLCLPNYCFPLPDGTTYQVLATDGAGNLYWTDVSSIPGASYTIQADTTTGGANLTLVDSAGGTDSVKFANGNNITVSRTDNSTITIAGATYAIQADTATGGANLTLSNSLGSPDSVKLAEGTNITITRTDANTITIGTVADNIPDGTAQGQLLVWDGTAWTADSTVTYDTTGARTQFRSDIGVAGRVSSAVLLVNDTGATAYGQNDGSGLLIGIDSDSQSTAVFASVNAAYDTTGNHEIRINTSNNNFAIDTATSITGGNTLVFGAAHGFSANDRLLYVSNTTNGLVEGTYYYVLATGLTTTQCQISLTENGSAVVLTNGTGLDLVFNKTVRLLTMNQDDVIFAGQNITLNAMNPGVAGTNATIKVERGTSGVDATITWDETDDRWELNNDLLATGLQGGNIQIAMGGSPDNQIYIGGNNLLIDTDGSHVVQSNSPIQTTAESMSINSDNTAVDSYLYMKGTGEYLKWNNSDTRFEFSDQLYISEPEIPAILERRVTTGQVDTTESASAIQLVERVTDAGSNATDDAGPSIMFSRTYGTSGNTPIRFANIGANYFGTTNTAEFRFNWSNDNYLESPVDVYPGTYSLLRLGSNNSSFYNNSIFVDYSAASTTTNTATSITGGNTLVFASAHGYAAGQRIQYTSTTQNGLTQNTYYYVLSTGLTTTQCQLGSSPTGSAISLTNGTGLTLVFANLINQIGINTNTPAYTLDVNGDANVSGDIHVSGVHVNLSTPVHQGQFLYVSNDVTPTITNSANIIFTDTTYRPLFEANTGVYGRGQSAAGLRNNTLTNNFTTGDGTSILYSLESNAQSAVFFGSTSAIYDPAGDSTMNLSTSTNNFNFDLATSITGGNLLNFSAAHGFAIGDRLFYASPSTNGLVYQTIYYVIAAGFTTTACQISLTQGGSAVALTNGTGLNLYFSNKIFRNLSVSTQQLQLEGTNLIFNAFDTGIAGVDATITVERGTSGGNAQLKWNETIDRWQFTNDGSTYYPMVINLDDLNDVVITTPNKGQILYYDGSGWVNTSTIQFDSAAYRPRFQSNIAAASGTIQSGLIAVKNTGATNYTDGDGSGVLIAVDDDSNPIKIFAGLSAAYSSTGNHEARLRSSTDAFVTVDKNLLAVNDDDLKVRATEFILNAEGTGSAAVDAQITVERGTTGTDSYIKWNEDPTPSNSRWEISDDLYAPRATIGSIDINRTAGQIDTNSGSNLTLDSDGGTVFVNDNLNVDAGTLYVDAANNRVGVINTSPQVALHVGGDIWGSNIVALGTVLATNGNLIQFNNEAGSPAGDCFLRVVDGVSAGNPSNIKWDDTVGIKRWQYTAPNSTSYLNLPDQNLDTTSDVDFASVEIDGLSTYNTQTTTTTGTGIQTISATVRKSQKVVINIIDTVTNEVHILEALAVRKGTSAAYLTTYAEMYSNTPLATFTADAVTITGDDYIRIRATPASANQTIFTVARVSLD